MMNKKAIAAFAAGATLLSGMAFAAPAFAETAPKQETCKVDEKALKAAQDAVAAAKEAKALADANVVVAENALKVEQGKYDAAKALVDAYKTAYGTYKADKAAEAGLTGSKLADAQAKTAHAADALKEAIQKANKNTKLSEANVTDTEVTDKTSEYNGKLKELEVKQATKDAVTTAKTAAEHAEYDLNFANYKLGKLQCTPAPAPQPGPQNPPVTPAQPGSKTEAIKNVLAKKVDVDAAEHNFAEKNEAYTKAAATLAAAKAELDAAEHDKAVVAQNLSDFEASGVNDSAKLQSLKEAVARADAHVVRTTTAFNKALADFNDAKTADLAAQAAYNAAKAAYDEAYNAAIKLGVNPALLPSVTAIDPLSPAFPQLAQAQKIYADALAGKFGAAAQKAVQKAEAKAKAEAGKNAPAAAGKAGAAAAKGELATKGGNGHKAGEKLGNAGVGVALTALAASMLAGMGAAVRKMRH